MPDWIETFVTDTQKLSPEPFRLWTGISIIAGALERRVWTENDKGILYPNLFVMLSGDPASGKTIMVDQARNLWSNVPQLHVGDDNPTKASFLRSLRDAVRTYTNGSGAVMFSALSMACAEFSVLFNKSDLQFFADLTDLYDNKDRFSAPRTSTVSVKLEKPTVNILAGVTPTTLMDTFPESAWGQGFTSRLMFIFGAKIHNPARKPFIKRARDVHNSLQRDLNRIFKLVGEFEWKPDAQEEITQWLADELPPVPNYGRLVHYVGRREAHVWKLSMIAAVSRTKALTVHKEDFLRARQWLLDAELTMPDVFKSMRPRSDSQLMQDMIQHMMQKQSPNGESLSDELLWEFFQERATSDRIKHLVEASFRSGMIRQGTRPGTFIPQKEMN